MEKKEEESEKEKKLTELASLAADHPDNTSPFYWTSQSKDSGDALDKPELPMPMLPINY